MTGTDASLGGEAPSSDVVAPELASRLLAAGQAHLVEHAAGLRRDARASYVAELASVAWERLGAALHAVSPPPPPDLRPPEALTLRRRHNEGGIGRRLALVGRQLLAAGKVATVLLAGGQGTRLGHPGPKGLFVLGPSPDRTLYAILFERVAAAGRSAGTPVPLVILVGRDTEDATRVVVADARRFGLDPSLVRVLRQGEMPAVDDGGRALLAAPGRLALAPDGHGGLVDALTRSSTLDWLRERGVEWLTTFQVDNALGRPLDPEFLGWAVERRAVAAGKAVRKRTPSEKVGVFARGIDGRVRIVEYSELPAEGAELLQLGSIAVHAWHLPWLAAVTSAPGFALPWHRARKRVPFLATDGTVRTPASENATKWEQFLFDLLPMAPRVAIVEVNRAREFAPLKNATGEDSPETARAAVTAEIRRWHREAGLDVTEGPLDLRPLEADGPDDLRVPTPG